MTPRIAHRGQLFNGVLDCFVLNNGERRLSKSGVVRSLATESETAGVGSLERYLERLPSKYAHLTSMPVLRLSRPEGGVVDTVESGWFYDLLCAYSEAGELGLLHPQQAHLAQNASRLIRAIGKAGIVALIDEATGYQKIREENELQGLVAKYLVEQPRGWERLWNNEVVGRLCQLYRVERKGPEFPTFATGVIGKIYRTILPPGVYEAVKDRNGSGDERVGKHHQFFKDDLWKFVNNDIPTIAYFARVSRSRDEFWQHIHARYGTDPFQPELPGVH